MTPLFVNQIKALKAQLFQDKVMIVGFLTILETIQGFIERKECILIL